MKNGSSSPCNVACARASVRIRTANVSTVRTTARRPGGGGGAVVWPGGCPPQVQDVPGKRCAVRYDTVEWGQRRTGGVRCEGAAELGDDVVGGVDADQGSEAGAVGPTGGVQGGPDGGGCCW